jgi:LEA14-like dessication related protein
MQRAIVLRLVASLSFALCLFGCKSLTADLQAPKLSLIGASMVSADVFSQQFRVRIKVDNPNARSLPIKKIDYQLYLAGDSFAEGSAMAPFVVPAQASTEFDLTLQTNFVSSIGRLLSRLNGTNQSAVDYDFIGKIALDIPFTPDLAFKERGVIDLRKR